MRTFRYLALALWVATGAAWAQATSTSPRPEAGRTLEGSGQAYPDKSRSLKVISSAGAGSSGDLMARAVARGLTEVSRANIIVENKPGAEGVIAMLAAKNAPPDGYTLLVTSSSTHVLNPHMIAQLPYDPVADFVPLAAVARISLVMNAGPTVPYKTAREFIEAARANPGKHSFGSGTTTTRLAGELLQQLCGIKMLSVPFKSVAEAMTGLVRGEADIMISDAVTASPHYKSGRVRPLAVSGATRMAVLPNVPTLREEGVADYEVTAWYATYFPARTSPETAAAMRELVLKAAKTRHVTEVMITFGMEPLDVSGDTLAALQRAESEKWGKVVRSANLRPQ